LLPRNPQLTVPCPETSQTLSQSLQAVHGSSSALFDAGPRVPEPLIQYVENGRNPDIYTREFVELVRRMNQLARGKQHAFAAFRDTLAEQMNAALPELRDDVRRVVDATGGPWPENPADPPADPTAGASAGAASQGPGSGQR
jgi:mediator of RNA polymerase II transcription subunit 10